MTASSELNAIVRRLRDKYAGTSFVARLDEAVTLADLSSIQSYWLRDSEIANVVWLVDDTLIDVTWWPELDQSILNVVPLDQVTGFEVRQKPDLTQERYELTGDLLVRAFNAAPASTLAWAADPGDAEALSAFFTSVTQAYLSARRGSA